jgi:hypothetical protein
MVRGITAHGLAVYRCIGNPRLGTKALGAKSYFDIEHHPGIERLRAAHETARGAQVEDLDFLTGAPDQRAWKARLQPARSPFLRLCRHDRSLRFRFLADDCSPNSAEESQTGTGNLREILEIS